MKQKSLKLNAFLMAIRNVLSVLFPMITFPYISRVLGVENVGRYNYASSIISYFLLLSGLGIRNYAIREGPALREDRKRLKRFADEMFTINVFSTIVSYALLTITLLASPGMKAYWTLLTIFSFQILLQTVGIDWMYSIYEDYLYITVRSIAFQILSVVLLFCFVHTTNDVNKYALITVLANAGSSVLNYIHAHKYVRPGLINAVDWKRHLRPILILFAMSLTVMIYVQSDITVLGILCGDERVGIYSVSAKIYSVVKTFLSAILVVSIPRLSSQCGTGRLAEFRETAIGIYRTLITVAMPVSIGIIVLSRPIVLLVSGPEYVESASSMAILGMALLVCMSAWFWGQCILVPMRCENEVFKVTVFSAVLNLGLNVILIPRWQENAAAFTTLLAEGCAYMWSMYKGRKVSGITGIGRTFLKSVIGCVAIVMIALLLQKVFSTTVPYILVTVISSIIVYVAIEICLKNEAIFNMLKNWKISKLV